MERKGGSEAMGGRERERDEERRRQMGRVGGRYRGREVRRE